MYDENKATEYINRALQERCGVAYDADEILNIIDIIWDYYDDNGLLDLDDDTDLDVNDLVAKVKKTIGADKDSPVKPEHIEPIVLAELDFENSIEDED